MKRDSEFDPEHKKASQANEAKSAPKLDFSVYERWNNLCAALAEDALLDEMPPGTPDDVDRIRKRIAQMRQQHADDQEAELRAEAEHNWWQRMKGEGGHDEQPKGDQDEPPSLRKM